MMQKIIATFCGLSMLGGFLFVPPLPSKADPVTVVVTLLVGGAILGGATIYDYNSCDINLLWGCGGSGGAGGGPTSGGDGGHGASSQPAPPPGEQQGVPSPPGGAGQGAPQACSSAPNACGMVSTGFINQGEQCSATPPPASSCPAPAIDQGDFYAQPALVKSGNTTTLHWDVSSATTCALSGGGLSLLGLSISGQNVSNSITQQTTFTLTCQNGVGGPERSAQTTVNVVPTYEEI